MKILLLGTAYPWRGGIAHYMGLLAKYLKLRHTVNIVTFTRQYPQLLFPGKSQEESGDPGIVLETEPLVDSMNPFNWFWVGWKLRQRNYDLLIFKYWLPFFGPCFGTIAHIVKFRRKTIVLAICDNVVPHECRIGDRMFTRYAFSAVDGYLVQSQQVENDLLQIQPNALYKRVEHPVYEIFGNEIPKEEARRLLGIQAPRVLLFFGYVRHYKGLDILLDAMARLAGELSLKLYVVGEFYDDEEKYRRRVEELNLNHVVEFVSNYVPNDQVAPYFCAADCVVLPYRSATQSGIVQIAYNFNKPVIITRVGGLTEAVIDGVSGFTVPPEDSDALAQAIVQFYSESWEERLREGVKEVKKRFSWEALVETIEEIATKVAEKRYHEIRTN